MLRLTTSGKPHFTYFSLFAFTLPEFGTNIPARPMILRNPPPPSRQKSYKIIHSEHYFVIVGSNLSKNMQPPEGWSINVERLFYVIDGCRGQKLFHV